MLDKFELRETPVGLGARIQRDPQAERLLSRGALGSLERPGNLLCRRLLLGKALQFANVLFGPFTSFRSLLGHDPSSWENAGMRSKQKTRLLSRACLQSCMQMGVVVGKSTNGAPELQMNGMRVVR